MYEVTYLIQGRHHARLARIGGLESFAAAITAAAMIKTPHAKHIRVWRGDSLVG